jgi:DnaB helicase-like protein/AAA domain-containing protein
VGQFTARAWEYHLQSRVSRPRGDRAPANATRPTSTAGTHRRELERPLPQNLEAERSILGAILLDNSALTVARQHLQPSDFFFVQHGRIYESMIQLGEKQEPIELVTLSEDLRRRGELESVGGPAYIQQLADGLPRVNNLKHYAKIVTDTALLRRVIHGAEKLQLTAFEGQDADEAVADLRKLADSLPASAPHGASSNVIQLQPYEQIKKEHLRYMWDKYFALGRLVHLAGDSGEGKSPLTVDLVARVTSGLSWPDGTPNPLGPRSAILLASEDDARDTIRPRLELAGADLSRVYDARCSVVKGLDRQEILLALDRDIQQLVARAREIPDLAFMVIDPITNYLGTVQMKLEEEVRGRLLMPLATAAAELGICVLTVGHLNRRDRGTSPLQRIMGAAAFHGVARFIYFVGPDPDDDDKHSHVLVQQRGGNSPSLRYRTVARPMSWDGETSEVVQIEWRGTSGATSQDAVDPQVGSERSTEDKAAKNLIEILKAGPVPAVEAKQLLKDAGHDVEKLNWSRVLHKARASSQRFPGERFYSWFLSTNQDSGNTAIQQGARTRA